MKHDLPPAANEQIDLEDATDAAEGLPPGTWQAKLKKDGGSAKGKAGGREEARPRRDPLAVTMPHQ
jgi:hypothetical protein